MLIFEGFDGSLLSFDRDSCGVREGGLLESNDGTMTAPKPAAEVKISLELVRTLLKEFVPDLGNEPIVMHSAGWDNEIFRVGEHHAVRLPRRELAAQLVQHEQLWLPELADALPVDIPVPIHAGSPAFGYPWSWSVVPWFDGTPLAHSPINADPLIEQLAAFGNAMHLAAPPEAPENPHRGGPLSTRTSQLHERLAEVTQSGLIDEDETSKAKDLWDDLVHTPVWGGEPMWIHGDLHPLNVIYRAGRISAVIDFGDLTSGDPAVDLAIAWMLFDEDDRTAFRKASTIDGKSVGIHTWNRARGWAMSLALVYLAHSADDPTMRRLGQSTFRRALG